MLIEHEGSRPSIAESAYVAPNAVACGDVTVGEGARVLFGAVLVADGGPVEVGSHSIVMEHALVRGRDGHAARIGAHVIVGPHAHVNGAVVERSSQPASPSSRARRSERGPRSASNGVVHVNTRIPPEGLVPISWIAVGDPAEIFPPHEHERIWAIQEGSTSRAPSSACSVLPPAS
ncbi:MAG TPA: hypothetical protein VE753_08780 [Gaiellaceae bacterium]|nr:hypothetical protein [Gaiellaceae bacterium]